MSAPGLALLSFWLSAPAAQAPDLDAALISAAQAAMARSEDDEVRRVLQGRASLGLRGVTVPAALQAAADEASAWAAREGRMRVFASRVGADRVRVGVDDPAGAVDRLDVFARTPAGEVQLTRAASEATGRNEYLVPPSGAETIVVRAVMRTGGTEIVLRALTLEAEAALPGAPSLAQAPTAPAPEAAPSRPVAPSRVRWWWVVAAGVAAALVGAAAWQETR